MKVWQRLLMFFSVLTLAVPVLAEMEFYRRQAAHDDDTRGQWTEQLLALVLQKTEAEFGPYKLLWAPQMSNAREWKTISSNRYPNFFGFKVFSKEYEQDDNIASIRFPIQLGLLGYRVCFYPTQQHERIARVLKSGDIKSLRIGQGRDWTDVTILRHNGYTVLEVENYKSLFKMSAASRFDLFCRGVNEYYDEYQLENPSGRLRLDSSFAFHYDMPVFFYTHKSNTRALARIEKGLLMAYEDGSLQALFTKFYGERIEFAQLHKRRIIKLRSPLVSDLPADYKKYNVIFDTSAVSSPY